MKKIIKFLSLLIYICWTNLSIAQEMPEYNIVMFDLLEKNGKLAIANPQMIAAMQGYDNQPSFSKNGKSIYFTHMTENKTDIWQWSKTTSVAQPLVETQLSEYSPTETPFETNSISVVRVESDGTQRLWKYTPGKGFSVLFEKIKPVGYHAWSGNNVAMFVLGEPHQLRVTQLGKKDSVLVDTKIGRCLQKRPGYNEISYTIEKNKQFFLKLYNFDKNDSYALKLLPAESQDYVWYSKQQLISSDGKKLFTTSIQASDEWRLIKNLSNFSFSNISRLALSPEKDKLAVVYIK